MTSQYHQAEKDATETLDHAKHIANDPTRTREAESLLAETFRAGHLYVTPRLLVC